MDDTKDVHLLALVLMYTLDLDIKECGWVDGNTGGGLDVLGNRTLLAYLISAHSFLNSLSSANCSSSLRIVKILQESETTSLAGNQLGNLGLAWCNQRLGVIPLVTLVNLSGPKILTKSLKIVVLMRSEWSSATPLTLWEPTIAR